MGHVVAVIPARGGSKRLPRKKALRSFCDRNGVVFVSEARGKDRPPPLERALADDRSHQPATIVELASISSVFISFPSTATLEAVYGGACSLCPTPPDDSVWLNAPTSVGFRQLMGY